MRLFVRSFAPLFLGLFIGCGGIEDDPIPLEDDGEEETHSVSAEVTCNPLMRVFPVAEPHNIGYDRASCGSGTCAVSCPDRNANSDWGGAHHGIDVFARRRAPLVAVADGTIVRVGVVSSTSGLRVRLRDACGWEYYYGHLDEAVVSAGQRVSAGQLIGFMGNTGTQGVHLHFNISPDGNYSSDINPFNLLNGTSGTACSAPPTPPPPAPSGCGILGVNGVLAPNQGVHSCSGRYFLVHQGDGNVVLYNSGRAIWHTATHGRSTGSLVMQGDGNLVLYSPGGSPLWHTHTYGRPGAILAVQDDGNAVIYQNGRAIWASNTQGR